jgi:hypothetical protein
MTSFAFWRKCTRLLHIYVHVLLCRSGFQSFLEEEILLSCGESPDTEEVVLLAGRLLNHPAEHFETFCVKISLGAHSVPDEDPFDQDLHAEPFRL